MKKFKLYFFSAWVVLGSLLFTNGSLAQESELEGIYNNGPLTMEFTAEGTYQISMGDEVAITGRYEFGEDVLHLEDTAGPMACLGKVGEYQYMLEEEGLRLRAANDPCAERGGNLSGEWNKKVIIIPIAITGGTLIDGNGGKPQKNMTVIVESGKITDIFRSGKKQLPKDTEVIDASGQYILPGFIDSHVHFATDPSGGDNHEVIIPRLRDYLYSGITTVRDMAGDTRSLAWLARNAKIDEIESPVIYYSSVIAMPEFFSDERTETTSRGIKRGEGPWARAFTMEDDPVLVIAEAKGTGSTAVKLYEIIGPEELKALTKEAHRQGVQVWTDITRPIKPSDQVAVGVDVISHTMNLALEVMSLNEFFDGMANNRVRTVSKVAGSKDFQKLLKTIRDKDIILDTTLSVALGFGGASDPEEQKLGDAMFAGIVAMTREAHKAGIKLAAGTDVPPEGPGAIPPLFKEMQLLVDEVGMTPMEVITSSTKIGAMATGIEKTHGTVEIGKAADMVILSKNPVKDIRNATSTVAVMKAGKLYKK